MVFEQKQIDELKAKNPGKRLYLIEVDGKSCILRTPTRQDLSYAAVVKDPIKLNEVMINQLWVDGDEEIKTDDDLFMAVCAKLEDILRIKEATIKKL